MNETRDQVYNQVVNQVWEEFWDKGDLLDKQIIEYGYPLIKGHVRSGVHNKISDQVRRPIRDRIISQVKEQLR
jgi:hypothetical protein